MNMEINKEKNILLDLELTHYLSVHCQNPRIVGLNLHVLCTETYPVCLACTLVASVKDCCLN